MAGIAVLREVSLALPMVDDMELAATKTVTALAQSMQMSPDKIDEVRMAVVEACINAFEHSGADDGMVYLTFHVLGDQEPETLRITVRDSGQGFDPGRLQKPSIEEKLKAGRKRGWGLRIIEGLMDEVSIQSGGDGTTVVMSKAR
jgi:serine/threonine-protein kinase RsbW